jgi:hypothetical protein
MWRGWAKPGVPSAAFNRATAATNVFMASLDRPLFNNAIGSRSDGKRVIRDFGVRYLLNLHPTTCLP